MLEELNRGDFVVYTKGTKEELGRIARKIEPATYFVCYSEGCTASNTPRECLRKASQDDIKRICSKTHIIPSRIGYNRFNETCSEYDEEDCLDICPEKSDMINVL